MGCEPGHLWASKTLESARGREEWEREMTLEPVFVPAPKKWVGEAVEMPFESPMVRS